MKSIFALLALLLLTFTASAEYRAYQLLITNEESGAERSITSILDDQQYREFYTLKPGETIQLFNTWMCYHNGSYGQPICPNPKNQ